MRRLHLTPRIPVLILLLLAATLAALPGGSRTAAQGDEDPAQALEALALRVHSHNLRTGDFTVWTGGEMGRADTALRPTWPLGTVLKGWQLSGFDETQAAVSWDDLQRPTLLNIWASWCHPCVQEFPDLTEIALHPEDHSYDVLFVNAYDDPAMARDFVAQQAPGLHILSDPEGTISTEVGSQAIPTSILLGADGAVLAIHLGSYTPAHAAFFEMIAQHPGVGHFDAADYPDFQAVAELAPIEASTIKPLTVGRSVSGTLDDDHFQQAYRFEGRQGQTISVRLANAGGDLEPYVVLLDAEGERLAESLDYAYDPVAKIQAFTLPADGEYRVVATRFLEADGLSAGRYELTVQAR